MISRAPPLIPSPFLFAQVLRGAWPELSAFWELANRPEIRSSLWPELSANGVSARQIMEPLQDIVLFGALAQLQFLVNDVDQTEDVKQNIRGVLNSTTIPAGKVDALLYGDADTVVSRSSNLLTLAHEHWLVAGGWNVERRMYAPQLSCAIAALDEDQLKMSGFAGKADEEFVRYCSESRGWEYSGTIVPRLHAGMTSPGASAEERASSMRVWPTIMASLPSFLKLLSRAQEHVASGEAHEADAPFVLEAHETTPAEFLLKEFDLDLKLLDSWSDEQVLDLRTLHYYLRQTDHGNKNLEVMGTIQRRGKRQVSTTGRIDRGFGGAGGGKRGANAKRGGGGAKRKRK
jgi:hypothetical protein